MKCSNCGSEIKDGEKFCTECGTKIEVKKINENQKSGKKQYSGLKIIIIFIIMFGIGWAMSRDDKENIYIEPITKMNEMVIPELTPVTINKNELVPEVTKELSYENLNYMLPSTYFKDTNGLETGEFYATNYSNNEIFCFAVNTIDSDMDVKSILEMTNDLEFQVDDFVVEYISEIKSEVLNGVTWYSKTVKQRSKDSKQYIYCEYYYANYNGKIYYLCFEIDTDSGKSIDNSRSNQFSNIKYSLKFN